MVTGAAGDAAELNARMPAPTAGPSMDRRSLMSFPSLRFNHPLCPEQ